jgi:hypothetical protein
VDGILDIASAICKPGFTVPITKTVELMRAGLAMLKVLDLTEDRTQRLYRAAAVDREYRIGAMERFTAYDPMYGPAVRCKGFFCRPGR